MSEIMFGLSIPTSVLPGTDPVATARMAEDLGFDFVSASDHPCGTEPVCETWTILSWVAAATSRIRVATRVLGVPYRNPAIVAKMAETFSRLSGGRLILGLGGGVLAITLRQKFGERASEEPEAEPPTRGPSSIRSAEPT